MAQKNKKKPVQQQLSPNKLIKERGRSYPVQECLINKDWKIEGMAEIIVIRKMGGDKFLIGSYIADIFCLGVKNCFARIMDEDDLKQFKKDSFWCNSTCDLDLAQNIIYGSVEYAEDLGLKPHPDFALAQYVLDDIDDVEYIEIAFGKNGKPLFMQGTFDKPLHILAALNKSVGAGNYHHIVRADEGFDMEEEDEELYYEKVEDDYYQNFEEEAKGLSDYDREMYFFAHIAAEIMDTLEHEYEKDYEQIDEKICTEKFQKVSQIFSEDLLKNVTNKEHRVAILQDMKNNVLFNTLCEFIPNILELTQKYEEVLAEIPDCFMQVVHFFYCINQKEIAKIEAGETDEDNTITQTFGLGLSQHNKVVYKFAYLVAKEMDFLVKKHHIIYEDIEDNITNNQLIKLRHSLFAVSMLDAIERGTRESLLAFEQEKPLLDLFLDIESDLVIYQKEYHQIHHKAAYSFVEIANYFFAVVKPKQDNENDDDGYIKFEEIK